MGATVKEDLYAVLGVERHADFACIRSAYRRAALLAHPDKGGSETAFHRLLVAFETLSHMARRAAYDRQRQHVLEPAAETRHGTAPNNCPQAHGVKRQQAPETTERCRGMCTGDSGSGDCSPGCEPSGSCGESERPGVAMKASQLQRSLQCLRSLLQALSPADRRAAMHQLAPRVRAQLLQFMEGSRSATQSAACVVSASTASQFEAGLELPNPAESSASDATSMESDVESSEEEPEKLQLEDTGGQRCWSKREAEGRDESGAGGRRRHTVMKGIETWPGSMSVPLYRTKARAADIEMYTSFQPKLEVAVEHHIILAQVRNTIQKSQRDGPVDAGLIRRSIFDTLVANETSVDAMGLKFLVVMRVYRFIGAKWVSSPVLPLDDVLKWRCRLHTARGQGWAAFRALWVELMQHPGYTRGQKRSLADAEAVSAEAWERHAPARTRREERLARSRARAIARIGKVGQKVEVALEAEAQLRERRVAAEERKAASHRRQLRVQRWRWLHRRDITIEEIMGGLPTHLQ